MCRSSRTVSVSTRVNRTTNVSQRLCFTRPSGEEPMEKKSLKAKAVTFKVEQSDCVGKLVSDS